MAHPNLFLPCARYGLARGSSPVDGTRRSVRYHNSVWWPGHAWATARTLRESGCPSAELATIPVGEADATPESRSRRSGRRLGRRRDRGLLPRLVPPRHAPAHVVGDGIARARGHARLVPLLVGQLPPWPRAARLEGAAPGSYRPPGALRLLSDQSLCLGEAGRAHGGTARRRDGWPWRLPSPGGRAGLRRRAGHAPGRAGAARVDGAARPVHPARAGRGRRLLRLAVWRAAYAALLAQRGLQARRAPRPGALARPPGLRDATARGAGLAPARVPAARRGPDARRAARLPAAGLGAVSRRPSGPAGRLD